MNTIENILVCPLNWGLGHATRDVQIIKEQLLKGNKVMVAASGNPRAFLKNEFPDLPFIELPGYKITYAQKPFFLIWLLVQLPVFLYSIIQEHQQLKQIIRRYKITQVISDNRYGLWNRSITSVLITHQIFIQLPKHLQFFSGIVRRIMRKFILKFDECWVPDYEDETISLCGSLAHGKKLPENVKYIGPLSRFKNFDGSYQSSHMPDVLAIISGPEPQRTIFERQIEQRFAASDQNVLMVCGLPDYKITNSKYANIKKVNHLSTPELGHCILYSKKIISRSGYSTIMDLHVLGKKAELFATPGQTEQEYLIEWQRQKH